MVKNEKSYDEAVKGVKTLSTDVICHGKQNNGIFDVKWKSCIFARGIEYCWSHSRNVFFLGCNRKDSNRQIFEDTGIQLHTDFGHGGSHDQLISTIKTCQHQS